jgi:hypothetical protein
MKVTSLLLRQRHVAKFALTAAAACSALVASSGAAVAGMHAAAGARSAVSSGTWGTAQKVPGLATLNKNGDADLTSVSCASPGNCSAGGFYSDTPATKHTESTTQAFVANEVNGVWNTAQTVPGTKALNKSGGAAVNSVSCAAPGDCSAGGFYAGSRQGEAFVAGETDGVWGTAQTVPGIKALNKGGSAEIGSVSCASPGNCGAGGDYLDGSGSRQVFVVGES